MNLQIHRTLLRLCYPIPYALRDKVTKEIDDMLKAGIVEPSDSPYAAPIVLIKKKDQSLRICLDFRDLNKQTISDPVLMPQIHRTLLRLCPSYGRKWLRN
jgi:predicted amino acid racemase